MQTINQMKVSTVKLFMSIYMIIVLGTSCEKADSKDVNQDKIYSEYELFYDKNTDKTYASAIFKFNSVTGTQLQLTAPSEIKFNNDVIPYDPIFSYYRKEYNGMVTTGTFTFKDTQGKLYSNVVTLSKEINNPLIDTIKRVGAYTYNWVGDNVATNETIGLTIGNTTNPLNFQVFIQNATNATNFILPLSQLNQLPIGSSYCQLDRQIQTSAPNATTAGGVIRGKYRALNKTLFIK